MGLSTEDMEALYSSDLPLTMWIDADGYVVKYEMDMTAMMQAVMDQATYADCFFKPHSAASGKRTVKQKKGGKFPPDNKKRESSESIFQGLMVSLNGQLGNYYSLFGICFFVHAIAAVLLVLYVKGKEKKPLSFRGAPPYVFLVGFMGVAMVGKALKEPSR